MDGFHDHVARYRDSFLSTDHSHVSVTDMWVSFKSEVLSAIERFIPSKMTKTKYSLPWIDSSIKRLIWKRDKLYFRARKSSSPDIKNHYKRFRAHVQNFKEHYIYIYIYIYIGTLNRHNLTITQRDDFWW